MMMIPVVSCDCVWHCCGVVNVHHHILLVASLSLYEIIVSLNTAKQFDTSIFLLCGSRDNGSLVAMLRDGDTSRISIDQLKALEKLLPDSGVVETLKSYSGDSKMLGTAEDFFIRLIAVKK